MKDLAGRVAVITGAGSGFGREFARIGASERMKLVLADVQQDALDEAVAEARGSGAQALGVRADVSSADQVQQLAARTVEKFGAVHLLFNNAGVAAAGPVIEMRHEDWRWVIDVDLWGPIHGVEAFVPRMVEQGQGGLDCFASEEAVEQLAGRPELTAGRQSSSGL